MIEPEVQEMMRANGTAGWAEREMATKLKTEKDRSEARTRRHGTEILRSVCRKNSQSELSCGFGQHQTTS